VDKSCSSCMTKYSNRWYSDTKNSGMHLCRRCYRKQNLTMMDILPNGTRKRRACFHCSAKETSQWYTCPDREGFMCRNCYSKSNGMQLPLERRHCNSCNADQTSQWHTDHVKHTGYICRKCYLARKSGSECSSARSGSMRSVYRTTITFTRKPEGYRSLPSLASIAPPLMKKPLHPPSLNPNLPPIHYYLKSF
jgi:hypothetical protein